MHGILVISYGATAKESRDKNISKIEEQTREKYGKIFTAFSSEKVRNSLLEKGEQILSQEQAMERMHKCGVSFLKVFPTHLIYGSEYDKIIKTAKNFSDKFSSIKIAKPLLSEQSDLEEVVSAIVEETKREEGEGLILVAHGRGQENFQTLENINNKGLGSKAKDVFICTIKGDPSFQKAVLWSRKNNIKRAIISPLMLTLGKHAECDVFSSGEDSLKSMLEAIGTEVSLQKKGVGEYAKIQQLYQRHFEEIL